jgi:large subunit ribosomal protein L3
MTDGIIGKKLGMTQVYDDNGKVHAVTAIEAGPCTITQLKTVEKEGYNAAQLGFGGNEPDKSSRKKKAKEKVHYNVTREFRVNDIGDMEPGQTVDVSLFKAGDLVNVTGISKGKGFAGTVKRHHFAGGPKTHGQSDRHRAPGSVGAGSTPGRVVKGMRMAGHMGHEQVTVSNLEVYEADAERNLLFVKGAVPGTKNTVLLIRKSRRVKR